MASDVHSLLKQHGPGLTSELIELMTNDGVSSAAARQRITRAQPHYRRLAGLRFAKNARFIYLDEQYGDDRFWRAMERAFQSSGKAYWGAVVGLKARGGRCPKSLFPSVCGAPQARSRQLSPERILERLCAIQLLEEVTDDLTGEAYVQFRPYCYHKSSDAEMRAILLAELVALHAIRDWARRIGFGSYGKFRLRNETEAPVVSGVAWDMSAPSYMRPLARACDGTLKPGFLVCDVNLNGPIGEDHAALFIRKHDLASAPINVAPILPLLVGEVFTQDAFEVARKHGITAVTVADLFGKQTAKALRDLIELLSNAGATAAMNPAHLQRVMNALTKIEGASTRLRGALFELAVGSLVKDVEGGYLVTGYKGRQLQSGRAAEIDVILDRPDSAPVLVLECKSKVPGVSVSEEDVAHWYGDRIPLRFEILKQDSRYADRTFRFELWSNGTFSEGAVKWLERHPSDHNGYTVGWRDGQALKEYARRAQSASIRAILNDHYFKHPLAKTAKSAPTRETEKA